MVSFALDEMQLYLDTHPTDEDALEYFMTLKDARKEAMEAYQSAVGPLVVEGQKNTGRFDWALQPWPWEGGRR